MSVRPKNEEKISPHGPKLPTIWQTKVVGVTLSFCLYVISVGWLLLYFVPFCYLFRCPASIWPFIVRSSGVVKANSHCARPSGKTETGGRTSVFGLTAITATDVTNFMEFRRLFLSFIAFLLLLFAKLSVKVLYDHDHWIYVFIIFQWISLSCGIVRYY